MGWGGGKLRKGRKVKVPKPPELVEDRTQRHTGTAKGNRNSPQGESYGGDSKDMGLTQGTSESHEREAGGGSREGGLAGTGLQTQKPAPKPLLFWAVVPGITLSPRWLM